jgi:[acyl-carrier-protein] S-malonyltransferase
MIADGVTEFTEVGPGAVLQGLIRKTNNTMTLSGISKLEDIA